MLDKTVEDIFQAIDILVSNIYIWAFHRLGKERSKPKKSKLALYNRRKLSATHKPFIDLDGGNLFFYENLEPINNKIAFKSRKYLHGSLIDKAYTRNGIFHIVPPSIGNGKNLQSYECFHDIGSFAIFNFDDANFQDNSANVSAINLLIFTITLLFLWDWNNLYLFFLSFKSIYMQI